MVKLFKKYFPSLNKQQWKLIDQLKGVNDQFEVVIDHLERVIDQLDRVIVILGPLTYLQIDIAT